MSRAKRQRAHDWGHWAETLAALLLLVKGYRILGRRVRGPAGELDLIARRGRVIAFVEVKARSEIRAAETALGEAQRRRIARAAEGWLAARPQFQGLKPRFDLVLVGPGTWPRHRVDAFRPQISDL